MTNGKVVARSLYEPEIRELLDVNAPGWKHRPMLLTFSNDRVRVYHGAAMVGAMMRRLGVRQGVAVLRVLSGESDTQADGIDRRTALVRGAGLVEPPYSDRLPSAAPARP